ncbi:FeoA domain-containing protein [Thiolinea disciformis]|uniref:FeoA domain-containing protein n=1 Tax=Thiolinea disciformis TaxID=125614 RepID=UPI0003734518|nr:FeoA domain-containing protein [Thiolinea disciformis]
MSAMHHPNQSLAQLKESQFAHIQAIQTDSATRVRLLGLGLGLGSRIELLRNRQGDVVIGIGNNRMSLGRSLTQHIRVQVQHDHG